MVSQYISYVISLTLIIYLGLGLFDISYNTRKGDGFDDVAVLESLDGEHQYHSITTALEKTQSILFVVTTYKLSSSKQIKMFDKFKDNEHDCVIINSGSRLVNHHNCTVINQFDSGDKNLNIYDQMSFIYSMRFDYFLLMRSDSYFLRDNYYEELSSLINKFRNPIIVGECSIDAWLHGSKDVNHKSLYNTKKSLEVHEIMSQNKPYDQEFFNHIKMRDDWVCDQFHTRFNYHKNENNIILVSDPYSNGYVNDDNCFPRDGQYYNKKSKRSHKFISPEWLINDVHGGCSC